MPADLLLGGKAPKAGGFIRFYNRTVKDEAASAAAGRVVHKTVAYIEKRTPGDKTNEVHRPARPEDKAEFPRQWASFEAGDREQVTGTPLSIWPYLNEARVADLLAVRIRTVEELAAVTDTHLQSLGLDGRRLRDAAQAWLEAAKGMSPVSKLQAEMARKDEQIADLTRRLDEMSKHMEKRKEK